MVVASKPGSSFSTRKPFTCPSSDERADTTATSSMDPLLIQSVDKPSRGEEVPPLIGAAFLPHIEVFGGQGIAEMLIRHPQRRHDGTSQRGET
jgi:hypothetical protein